MEQQLEDDEVREAELGNGLTRVRLPLNRLRRGGYARVVVVDAAGRKAWSNPIWFDGPTP
jgi:hypothetical protein